MQLYPAKVERSTRTLASLLTHRVASDKVIGRSAQFADQTVPEGALHCWTQRPALAPPPHPVRMLLTCPAKS